MSGGGGGGGSNNTVTQSVQIPEYEQGFSQENQDLSRALGSQSYPMYQGPLIQQFAPQQVAGMQMAGQAATAYQPDLSAAEGVTSGAVGNSSPMFQTAYQTANNATLGAYSNGMGAALGTLDNAVNNGGPNAQSIAGYMSPYIQQSLNPQIQNLQTQLAQQQNQINAQATQANAFGDARQGTEQALQNYYGNQALSGLVGQGYNTGYNNAVNTALAEQQQQGQLGAALGSMGIGLGNLQVGQAQQLNNIANAYGQMQLGQGNQMANLAGLQQSLGISGANALYNAGQQQQTQGQQELNAAYQQYLNQVNWPYQMLNVRESALSNSPYNMVNATTVPQANTVAQGFGAGIGALGSLGALLGGGGSNAPFGGSAFPSPH